MVEPQEMLPETQKKDIKEHKEYIRIKSEEYRNVMKEGYNLLREWVPGTANLSRLELLKKTVKYIQELQQKDGSTMERKKKGIQELEHKIKELEKELFKKQENYIKELEHKENYIKELEQKIKELETSQTALSHRSFIEDKENYIKELEHKIKELETSQTALSHRSFTDLDTGLSEMVDATSMEISEEELLASGIPEFNSFEHFRQWLDCETA
jgi:chromosome segregation ATPase